MVNLLSASTLRPGLLVVLKSSVAGNVAYDRRDIETDHVTSAGTKRAVWETARTITDPVEQEAAIKARSKARSIITSVCARSNFGLLCADDNVQKLQVAIADAQKVVDGFNSMAKITTVELYVLAGRVEQSDVQAVRAINSEVRDLIGQMERGIRNMDAKDIRDAADRARGLGQMLSKDASDKVQEAIVAARRVAREIIKAGSDAAVEVDRTALATLAGARTAFLDVDFSAEAPEASPVEENAPAPVSEAADLELIPEKMDVRDWPDEAIDQGFQRALDLAHLEREQAEALADDLAYEQAREINPIPEEIIRQAVEKPPVEEVITPKPAPVAEMEFDFPEMPEILKRVE